MRVARFVSALTFGVSAILPAAAAAQPTVSGISGTVGNGQTITISGASFGTKTTAAPLISEDFADGLLDSKIVVRGGTFALNDDNLRHGFSTHNARADYKNSNGYYFGYDNGTAPKWYVQYWIKLASNWHWGTSTFGGGDDGLANIKFFRLFPTGSRTYSDVGYSTHGFDGGNILRFVENGAQTYLNQNAQTYFTLGTWHQVQVAFGENSGIDQPDGTLKLWIDGVQRDSITTLVTNVGADGPAINKRPYIVGFYDSWSPSDASVANMYAYYSDLYIDTSWSRVELGNAATYAASTHRETMIPTVWSAASISAKIAQGTFNSGDTAYVYVVDSNGAVNASGFRVTVGGTGPTAPRPPTNVRIIR